MSTNKNSSSRPKKSFFYSQVAPSTEDSGEESEPDEETPLSAGLVMDEAETFVDDAPGDDGADEPQPPQTTDQEEDPPPTEPPQTDSNQDGDPPVAEEPQAVAPSAGDEVSPDDIIAVSNEVADDAPEVQVTSEEEDGVSPQGPSEGPTDQLLQVEAAGTLQTRRTSLPGEVEGTELEEMVQLLPTDDRGSMGSFHTPSASRASPALSPPPEYPSAVEAETAVAKEPPPYSDIRSSKLPSYDAALRQKRLSGGVVADGNNGVELITMRSLDESGSHVSVRDGSRPSSREAWPSDEGSVQEDEYDDVEAADTAVDTEQDDKTWQERLQAALTNPRTIIVILLCALFLIFLIFFSISWNHVEYYELAFKMRKTGYVFAQDLFQMGAYMIGIRHTFKYYPAIAQSIMFEDVRIFTSEPLRIGFDCHLQYFLRVDQAQDLEQEFDKGYKDIIETVSFAAVKNAASGKSVDDFLLNRAQIEREIHDAVKISLEGNCCPSWENCFNSTACDGCVNDTETCSRGYFVRVPYFNLLKVHLPSNILERKMRVLIVDLEGEEEIFRMQETLTRAETDKLVQRIRNEADEVTANATAQANRIRTIGGAEATAKVEDAICTGLSLMYNNLTVTDQHHKASLHWLRTLERHQNLISGVSFDEYMKLVSNG